ncbi:AAA family ATPase, partial [Asticcacaulis sp.]|uniref:ATP-binding protein n=1 Tax=Asticcacaulis sp. TaxID=1872648 RepID=UPI002636B5D6
MSLAAFLDVAVGAAQSLTQSHLKGEALGMSGIAGLIPPGRVDPQWLLGEDYIYTAPERLHGSAVHQDAPSSDLYALGVLFYQILTGRRPFDAVDRAEWRHAHLAIEPRPPSAFIASLPPLIDAIVLRLLNKDPADRYISAEALYVDLAACASALNSKGNLPWFEPGGSEAPFRFDQTDGLLEHSEQVRQIEAVIGRVSREGKHAMAFVSGPGGIGKTSLVHYAIKTAGVASAAGKSDKLQRDKPYDAVAQVLRILFNRLLSAGEDEIESARVQLTQQLEGHGRAIVDLVPEAEPVLGVTPPLAEVSAQIALSRTQNAICRTLEFFATSARPLVLFFDDLQWADALTLGVIGAVISRAPEQLCLIGAYRDGDEITAELARLIGLARSGQSPFTELVVSPLSLEDTRRAIRASLPGNVPQMGDIGEMIHRRTSG